MPGKRPWLFAIARDEEIKIAVVIVIDERKPAASHVDLYPSCPSYVLEGSIFFVMQEEQASVQTHR